MLADWSEGLGKACIKEKHCQEQEVNNYKPRIMTLLFYWLLYIGVGLTNTRELFPI